MNSPDNQNLAQKKASDIDTVLAAELNNLPEYLKEIPKIIIEYFYRRFGFRPSKPEGWVISNRTGMNKGSPPQAAGYSLLKQNCLF